MLAPDALLQNRYLVLRPIGKGGMGAVYLARDERLGNTIALKETFFEDERLRRAFEHEARLLARKEAAPQPSKAQATATPTATATGAPTDRRTPLPKPDASQRPTIHQRMKQGVQESRPRRVG